MRHKILATSGLILLWTLAVLAVVVVGHSGAAFPAAGASVRVSPATGNGFVLMVSGGRGATNQLPHDWVYWETGKLTAEARRELVYARLVPAAIVIALGVSALALWRLLI